MCKATLHLCMVNLYFIYEEKKSITSKLEKLILKLNQNIDTLCKEYLITTKDHKSDLQPASAPRESCGWTLASR